MAGTSVSALLRTATSAAKTQQEADDAIAAQQFSQSAQTIDDFNTYQDYLTKRIEGTTNPLTTVTLQNKLTSAFTSYTSNRVQLDAINVMEGSGTLTDKQNDIIGLYNQAASVGDFNLAQNLRSQYDTLNIQIQNQNQANAQSMSDNNVTNFKELADSYLTGDDPNQKTPSNAQIVKLFQTQGADAVDKLLTAPDGTQYSMWDVIYSNIYNAAQALMNASNSASSPSQALDLYDQASNIINGTTKYNIAGASVNINDVINAQDAARNGQVLYQPTKDANGNTQLTTNKTTDYVWARDSQGNLRIVQTKNELSSLVTDAQDPNNPGQLTQLGTQLKTKLKQAGYDVIGVDSTTGLIRVRQTDSSPGGKAAENIPGTAPGESFEVAYDPTTGDVRFESSQTDPNDPNSQQIFAISLNGDQKSNNEFGQVYKVNAAGDTFFDNPSIGSVGSFNPSTAPKLLDTQQINGGPMADLQGDGSTSSLLFQNDTTRTANLTRLAAATATSVQAANTPLQSANPGFNINTLPVPAGAKLSVNNLPNPTTISLAKPTPLPNIAVNTAPNNQSVKVVNPGPPAGSLSVSNAPNNQTIKI